MTEDTFQRMVSEGGFDGLSVPAKRTGGRRSKQKGDRFEREIVNRFLAEGISAERVPLSGAAGGSYTGDLTVAVNGQDWLGECKSRASGFKQLYDWLGSNRLLFVRSDRNPGLVVLRVSDLIEIMKGR